MTKQTTTKTTKKTTARKPAAKKLTLNEKLIKVIDETNKDENKILMPDPNIPDKTTFYVPVKTRLRELRKVFGFDIRIVTNLINGDDLGRSAVFETHIYIRDDNQEWYLVSNGHAFEEKGSSATNRINFLENCETSSVGRALSFLGIDGGGMSDTEYLKQFTNQGVKESKGNPIKTKTDGKISPKQIKEIKSLILKLERNENDILRSHKVNKFESLSGKQAENTIILLKNELDDHKEDSIL